MLFNFQTTHFSSKDSGTESLSKLLKATHFIDKGTGIAKGHSSSEACAFKLSAMLLIQAESTPPCRAVRPKEDLRANQAVTTYRRTAQK